MSINLQHCLKELEAISKLRTSAQKKARLKTLKNKGCVYLALKEIAMNIMNKNIPIPSEKRKEILRHVKLIKALTKPKLAKLKQDELVIQSGGFIGSILPIVLPVLSSLLMNATSRN